ncbi:hypothetical protein POM88_026071 [Heracleum sosnowskyi]|uniref:Uncharacterized protein n=1 Tax=Heracleum sosnowskyi TaxID=360622 RepID=A0AAD8I541_9APIA|nr:hypothetical protein POM88_026071 [Heracleum sosnowskyi]
MKYGIVPIDDDDDVELMFGVVISKGSPYFVEVYVEKVLIASEPCEMIESSRVGETSTRRCLEINEIVDSGVSNEKSAYRSFNSSFDSSKVISTLDDSVMETTDDVLSPLELRKGNVFNSKEELSHVVKEVHIPRKRSVHGCFEIMESSGLHTCMNPTITQDHYNLKSSDIVGAIRAQIAADPAIKEIFLLATTESVFGYRPARKKIRNAKKHAIDELYGSWEGTYEELPHLVEELQSFNVGTKVD